MIGFGNLEGTEKKITSKLSTALSEGNMGSDKSAAINFSQKEILKVIRVKKLIFHISSVPQVLIQKSVLVKMKVSQR